MTSLFLENVEKNTWKICHDFWACKFLILFSTFGDQDSDVPVLLERSFIKENAMKIQKNWVFHSLWFPIHQFSSLLKDIFGGESGLRISLFWAILMLSTLYEYSVL